MFSQNLSDRYAIPELGDELNMLLGILNGNIEDIQKVHFLKIRF